MKTIAVIPAAGSGKRLGLKVKKPFVLLNGKPLITYCLGALESSNYIDGIIVAIERSSRGRLGGIVEKFRFTKVIDIVIGGRTRFESVGNCLKRIAHPCDIILIHDGARPFLDKDMIKRAVVSASSFGACVFSVPENDTVKVAGRGLFVRKTLDRSRIWRAQTPQAFRYDIIKKAYTLRPKGHITDDASLVERLGRRVKILRSSYRNIKITTKEDLKIAEVLL